MIIKFFNKYDNKVLLGAMGTAPTGIKKKKKALELDLQGIKHLTTTYKNVNISPSNPQPSTSSTQEWSEFMRKS